MCNGSAAQKQKSSKMNQFFGSVMADAASCDDRRDSSMRDGVNLILDVFSLLLSSNLVVSAHMLHLLRFGFV